MNHLIGNKVVAAAGTCLLLSALGCVSPESGSSLDLTQCYGIAESCIDSAGSHHTYIVDSVELPKSAGESSAFGLDLDGNGRVENRLGGLISALSAVTPVDFPALIDGWIADGTLMILVDFQASDLSSAAAAGSRLHAGANSTPAPCAGPGDALCGNHLAGNASVQLDSELAVDAVFAGDIEGGEFISSLSPVSFTLDIPEFFPRPVSVNLIGARVHNSVSGSSLSGLAAGAITIDEIYGSIYPAAIDIAARDCTGVAPSCCVADSLGEAIVDLFDTDNNCAVTVEEMKNHTLLSAIVAPDLDLLDASGNFAPGGDGIKESMSVGARFTATGASFPVQ